jgi:hypothetical protein
MKRILGAMLVLATLAACGEQGGELRDETARRRAAGTSADSLGGDGAAEATDPGRLPAFVLNDSAPAPTPTVARVDTPAAPPPPDPQPAADPLGQWTAGTSDRVRTVSAPVVLRDVRFGVNAGFDRVVLEFLGSQVPGYRVEYVDEAYQCGSGEATRVAGGGRLAVTLRGTEAHNERGQATVQPRERRLNMSVVKEMEFTCDFEGEVQVVLGVSAPNRYRVTELSNPTRLIVDVQQ